MKCLVCGIETDSYENREGYEYLTEEFRETFPNINMCICPKCKLVMTDIDDTEDNNAKLIKYYESSYRDSSRGFDLSSTGNTFYRRAVGISKMISDYADAEKYHKNGCVVFEKGAGYGVNLMLLKRTFPNAVLYTDEMSGATQDNLQQLGVIKGIPEKCDIIVLSHVLEHLLDPKGIFEQFNNMLNEGGLVYVEVPNSMNFIEPHVTFWTPGSMRTFFEDHLSDKYELLDMHTTGFPCYTTNGSGLSRLKQKVYDVLQRVIYRYAWTNWRIDNGVYLRLVMRKK